MKTTYIIKHRLKTLDIKITDILNNGTDDEVNTSFFTRSLEYHGILFQIIPFVMIQMKVYKSIIFSMFYEHYF